MVVGEAARARDALVLIHVAESPQEDAAQRERHGSVPRMLASLGLLGGRVLAAHSVHLSDEDIAVFAAHGVAVAHCPGSNAKLASGIARVPALRAARGARSGLGTDGPASNDDLDLWEEMRLAALARPTVHDGLGGADGGGRAADGHPRRRGGAGPRRHRRAGGGPLGGRRARGRGRPAFAAGLSVPDEHLLANLVWAAGARNVRDVWVGGEQVVADHEPTKVDRAKVAGRGGRGDDRRADAATGG